MKVIKDPIHGYIEIPDDVCRFFIDTPIFQRLRYIEQTSMRCLFPSARHDRFAHSLGVYHLGKLSFDYLIKNVSHNKDIESLLKKKMNTFEIACLMHDCAHSPFSHTFENEYNPKSNNGDGKLDIQIKELINNTKFNSDFEYCNPNPHEIASSIVLFKHFKDGYNFLNVDIELCIRMIMGCTYHGSSSMEKEIDNCIIGLLNSNAIDVDKLDYILRDTKFSGISNFDIDIKRIISAIMIFEPQNGEFVLGFKRSALSLMESVIDSRNYIYKWIYSHHKVVYTEFLLRQAVEELSKEFKLLNINFQERFFSIDVFENPQKIGEEKIYQINDGDLIFLLKKYCCDKPFTKKYLDRKHYRALWKNPAEYDLTFENIDLDKREIIYTTAIKKLNFDLKSKNIPASCEVAKSGLNIKTIVQNSLWVEVEGKPVTFDKLNLYSEKIISPLSKHLFYVYGSESAFENRDEIIKVLRSYK